MFLNCVDIRDAEDDALYLITRNFTARNFFPSRPGVNDILCFTWGRYLDVQQTSGGGILQNSDMTIGR